ncbi:GPI10 [[Candida] subhashii]|uniref:Mannosyltransferase n=1 Tax=[Candida] subhashii TaxID=561895 RepID=A0A8J5UGI3_9ASCO|nr:GPI10 [[Candida] subhashii]KAG7660332.1 GPI10 [[Candida] subhashii]
MLRNRKLTKKEENDDSTKADNVIQRKTKKFSSYKLIVFIFIIRLINSFTIQTYFQADEYYQALEPAHNFIYGYGYMTWEWKQQLRSSIHPLIYALGYKLAGENGFLIHSIPKIINAIIATSIEYNLYKFVEVYDSDYGLTTLILSLLNPFNWYVITRSFSNNLETMLTVIALRFWPWDYKLKTSSRWFISLGVGLTSCIIRPTNILIWLPLGIWLLLKADRITFKWVLVSISEVVLILCINTYLDYYFYQKLTFPLYNFLEFNVFKNLSIFYGSAPWHFYIGQAIPLMMMLYLPLMVFGIRLNVLTVTSFIYVVGFSLIEHKEFRFIYPLQPIMLYFSAIGYRKLKPRRSIIAIAIVLNICIGLFFTLVNERGVIDVIQYLQKQLQQSPTEKSIGFITPCHSTPWQSQFHDAKLDAWFLTCEPPLHLDKPSSEEISSYRDESDQFYDSPLEFLQLHLGNDLPYPEYLIIFQPLEQLIDENLGDEYYQCQRFFNSYFHWDSRRSGDIIVYCRDHRAHG